MTARQACSRAQARRFDVAAFDEVCDHLGKPGPLRFGEAEFDAETKSIVTHDLPFEAPKSVDVENGERADRSGAGGFEPRAIGGEIADDAFLFPFAFGRTICAHTASSAAMSRRPSYRMRSR